MQCQGSLRAVGLQEKVSFSKDWKEGREGAMGRSGGKAFQEESSRAKALGLAGASCGEGEERRGRWRGDKGGIQCPGWAAGI